MAELESHLASVDGVTLASNRPTLADVGSPSTPLSANRTWQLLVSGNAYDPDANTQAELALEIGGVPVARYVGTQQFGTSVAGALAAGQIACAYTFTTGVGQTPTMQFRGASTTDGDALATGLRALAFDVTGIPSGNGRYSSESANTDTVTTGPAAGTGWQTVQGLTFTPAREGDHMIFVSAELVPNGSATATQQQAARVLVDGVPIGQGVVQDNGPNPTTVCRGFLAVHLANLDATEHTITLQVNGTLSGGNVDTRRRAIQVYEAALFEAVVFDQQSSGLLLAANTSSLVPGLDVTLPAPAAARRIVALCCGPTQTSFWKQGQFALGDTPTLVSPGFGSATNDTGVTAADDVTHDHGLYTAASVTAPTRFRVQYGQFAPGGGGANGTAVGQQVAIADVQGPVQLLAFVLDADSPIPSFDLEATVGLVLDTPAPNPAIELLCFANVTLSFDSPAPDLAKQFALASTASLALGLDGDLLIAGIFELESTLDVLALDVPAPELSLYTVYPLASTVTIGLLVDADLAEPFELRSPRYPVTVVQTRELAAPYRSAAVLSVIAGSVTPSLDVTLLDADGQRVPIDEAELSLALEHKSTGEVVVRTLAAGDAVGRVVKDWSAGDLAITPGHWRAEIRATWPDGRIEIFPTPPEDGPAGMLVVIWRAVFYGP